MGAGHDRFEGLSNRDMVDYVRRTAPFVGDILSFRFEGASKQPKAVRRALRYVALLQIKSWEALKEEEGAMLDGAFEERMEFSTSWYLKLHQPKRRC